MRECKTKDIKLAALLLAKIPSSSFRVDTASSDGRLTIVVSFQESFKDLSEELTTSFINCEAVVNLYLYNHELNKIRDVLKGGGRWKNQL